MSDVKQDADLRMGAYYYGFSPTRCRTVNEILSAVATAGKAYHHTENWNEPDQAGVPYVQRIQDAAINAADHIEALNAEIEKLRDELAAAPDERDA